MITGDLVDSSRTDIDDALAFAGGAAGIAPTYYVTDNHEAAMSQYGVLKSGLEVAGVTSGIDLILSDHAHGGQFRLPFVGGLIAPNQGLFPKYDAGLYTGAWVDGKYGLLILDVELPGGSGFN